MRRLSEVSQTVPDRNPEFREELTALLRLLEFFPQDETEPDFERTLDFIRETGAILGPNCWTSWKTSMLLAPILGMMLGDNSGSRIIDIVARCWNRSADLHFWRDFLADETLDLMPRIAIFVSWAPLKAFHALQHEVAERWQTLEPWQMSLIQKNIQMQHIANSKDFSSCRFTSAELRALPDSLPGCIFPSLEGRFERNYATPLMVNAGTSCLKHESVDLAYRTTQLINVLGRGKVDQLDADLSRIKVMFPRARSNVTSPLRKSVTSLYGPRRLPRRFILEILENPLDFPFVLVDAAQQAANALMVEKLPSLTTVSRRDKWFA
jgi:hypothetical protein